MRVWIYDFIKWIFTKYGYTTHKFKILFSVIVYMEVGGGGGGGIKAISI